MLSNQQSMELTRVIINCIDNVMASMLALSVVDHWITGQTKDRQYCSLLYIDIDEIP
jgi:hypothetical protein